MNDTIKINNQVFTQKLINFYILFGIFGGILFSVLFKLTNIRIFLSGGAIKDILLLILVFTLFLLLSIYVSKSHCEIRKDLWNLLAPIILFTGVFVLSCMKSHASIGTIIFIARRYFSPIFIITYFLICDFNEYSTTKLVSIMVPIIFFFGMIEYCLPDSFWNEIIALPNYWIESGDKWALGGIRSSGRFYTWDLMFIFGHSIRRMCSFFAEPTNLSSFLISAFCILDKKYFSKFLCFIGCCFAVSKAALMDFIFVFPTLYIYRHVSKKKIYTFWYIVMFVLLFIISATMCKLGLTIGPFAHIAGFYQGVDSILHGNFFGYGIGNTGNYAENSVINVGGESGVGGMLAQCGIGSIFYFLFFYKLIKVLQKKPDDNFTYIMMIFGWVIICIFSESAFGASGNILFFIYPAIFVRKQLLNN